MSVQLLRCTHVLWPPSVLMSLPPRVKGVLEMGVAEQAALVRELATIRTMSFRSFCNRDSRSDFGSGVEGERCERDPDMVKRCP